MKYLKCIDFFPKLQQDAFEPTKTKTGGLIFTCLVFLLAFLVMNELHDFFFGTPSV